MIYSIQIYFAVMIDNEVKGVIQVSFDDCRKQTDMKTTIDNLKKGAAQSYGVKKKNIVCIPREVYLNNKGQCEIDMTLKS